MRKRLDVMVGGMGDLMGKTARQFVVGADELQQAGIDIHIAARQRESVDVFFVNDEEVPGERERLIVAVILLW